jgi:hypothetical protein
MSVSLRCSGALAAALALLTPLADARQGAMPNSRPQVMPAAGGGGAAGAAVPNTGGLGSAAQQLPPNLYGYNPASPSGYGAPQGPAAAGTRPFDPYALSTAPTYNPYTAGSAGMSNSPYSLSTTPSSNQSIPPIFPYGPGYGEGMIGAGPGVGYGTALQGLASYTQAAGRYWIDIQQARMTREQVYQMQIETARRRIQFEAWYETVRPTSAKMIENERISEIDRARKDASDGEITSGRALNALLGSIKRYGKYDTGPTIPLDDSILKQLNLSGGASTGNVGMLKDDVKLNWPEALQDPGYDESRKQLTRKLREAVGMAKDGDPITPALLKDIRNLYASINNKFSEAGQDDVSAQQYMEARRFLTQLNSSISALRDPNVSKYFNNTWNAKGHNVKELVDHMTREGLTFAPAAPGQEAAYRAMYPALRAFEAALQVAQR